MSNSRKPLMKRMAAVLIAATGALMLSSGAYSQASKPANVIKWRLQAHLPTGSGSWQDSVVAMRDKLAERTGGRLQIELHAANSLMGATDIFPAVRRGILQMGYTSPAYLMEYMPTTGLAFAVPGAFQDVWEAVYFWKNLGFEDLIREEAAQQGVYYFTDKLYPTEMVLRKPVNSLRDFSSLRIRSAGMLQRYITQIGAATSYIPGPDIYPALSTGVVDGAHWGAVQEANSLSLYETAKYHVRPALGIGGVEAFIINKKAMESLPADIRQIVTETLEEHFWLRTMEYQYQELKLLKQLSEEKGVQVVELPEEVQAKMWEVGRQMRAEEAKKSDNAREAVRRLEEYLKSVGR